MRNSRSSCRERLTETAFCVDFDGFCRRYAESGQTPGVLRPGPYQLWQSNQIVSRGREGEHPADAGQTTVTGLTEASRCFGPAKHRKRCVTPTLLGLKPRG